MTSDNTKPLIIFDLDGVLINSLPVMRLAFEAALREVVNPHIEQAEVERWFTIYQQHLGKGFLQIMAAIGLPASMYQPFRRNSQYLQRYIYLYPNILSLISQLQAHYDLSIVTGKDSERATALLKQLALDDVFAIISGTDEGCQGKPAPDLLLDQMERLNKPKDKVMMIGDATSDIQAAHNSGVVSCAALWGYSSKESLTKDQPHYMADSPSDLYRIIQQHFS